MTQRALFLVFLIGLPIGVIWLLFFTGERGMSFVDRVRNWRYSSERSKYSVHRDTEDAYLNILELRQMVWELEEQGKDLFGYDHTWQIDHYDPAKKAEEIPEEDRIDGQFTAKSTPVLNTISDPGRLLADYYYVRRSYSLAKHILEQEADQLETSIGELPDNVTFNFALKGYRNLQDSQFLMGDVQRPLRVFETKIKPLFN